MQTDMSKSHLTSLDWRVTMSEGPAGCMAGALCSLGISSVSSHNGILN